MSKLSNSEISFLVDTMLIETLIAEPRSYKTAGLLTDLLSKVKDYASSKIDPANPAGSALDILAPGALWLALQSMGLGKLGFIFGLLMEVFHVDIEGMIRSVYDKIKPLLSGGGKVSSEQIDEATAGAAQAQSENATEQDAQEGYKELPKYQTQQAQQANDGKVYSSLELMHDAKIINLAAIEYERHILRLTKTAGFLDFLTGYKSNKAKGSNLLGTIIGWLFKVVLYSGGLMVLGDVVNKVLGRPNSLDKTYQAGQPNNEAPSPDAAHATQTKYPLKGDSPIPSEIPMTNTPENISNILIQFAKDVYSGLDGKEALIENTPGFQVIKEKIAWLNVYNKGSATIMMLPNLSKKELVDYFIDDVAKADTSTTNAVNTVNA
jgi:hypothetical protein